MRRALALAVTAALAVTGVASAETWTKFATLQNGADVSYDADYTYRDRQSGRLVVMQALSKGTTGPSAPGKPDSIGSVVGIDCSKKNFITLGAYKPAPATFEVKATWRSDTPKKADAPDYAALVTAVCAKAGDAPLK